MSQLCSKPSAKAPPPENSLAIGGRFEGNTFLVTALDWLKKERKRERERKKRKKMNDSDRLAVSGLPL